MNAKGPWVVVMGNKRGALVSMPQDELKRAYRLRKFVERMFARELDDDSDHHFAFNTMVTEIGLLESDFHATMKEETTDRSSVLQSGGRPDVYETEEELRAEAEKWKKPMPKAAAKLLATEGRGQFAVCASLPEDTYFLTTEAFATKEDADAKLAALNREKEAFHANIPPAECSMGIPSFFRVALGSLENALEGQLMTFHNKYARLADDGRKRQRADQTE